MNQQTIGIIEPVKDPSETGREELPLLAIRDVVLFPLMVLPIAVGRDKSVRALESSSQSFKRRLFLVTQKSPQVEDPSPGDLYSVGTIGEIVQVFKMPDGSVKTFVQGLARAKMVETREEEGGFLVASVEPLAVAPLLQEPESEALLRQIRESFAQYVQVNPKMPPDTVQAIAQVEDTARLSDLLAAQLNIKTKEKQEILEMLSVGAQLERLLMLIQREIEILNLEKKIQSRVRGQIEKTQRDYVLNEQMKAIQKELKHRDDSSKEIDELKASIKKAKMTKEAEEAAMREMGRLEKMMPYSPEATVIRTYVDWLISLPWAKSTRDNLDLKRAEQILEEDHYGLDKAKERILEYLAVCRLKGSLKGPILCFVGPPGVGKTSLVRSIARSLGRRFSRISLGGVRDESEIRGHRRTYIGALPGRIVQQVRKVKSRNPVILLDELDKMGSDWRGDPAAALLEVLDPEQNRNFVDHYLEVGFDLSRIFFIATANTTFSIPSSLKDRLEILQFSGYVPSEKMEIARRYLIPKQLKEHGLKGRVELNLGDQALRAIMNDYTQESGVRGLEREIASLSRKVAKEAAGKLGGRLTKKQKEIVPPITIEVANREQVQKYLGVPKYNRGDTPENGVGAATGLAWTEHGGELLHLEVASVPGKGDLILTGKLGEVMQESAVAAFSFIKTISAQLPFEVEALRTRNFHLHAPEGAIPKDGPSAGIAMASALASFLTRRAIKPKVAMTGEVTLHGRVLGVGGIKEKLVAAHREGMQTVLIPEANRKDLEDLPREVKEEVKIVPVSSMRQVLDLVLS